MTDEEKKAIEWLKRADWFSARLYSPTILNLIDKQSKEIEDNKKKSNVIIEYQDLYEKLQDKIKAKIDYLLKNYDSENFINFEMFIKILQSLLEKE